MTKYEMIGLMSGTSLDGLDMVHVQFEKNKEKWGFQILNACTQSFSETILLELKHATELTVPKMQILDKKFAKEMARMVNDFVETNQINKTKVDGLAVHGQTVFHQPQNGFSLQIGCGATLAFETGMNVINDFRSKDIVAGGQGAPLVPIGDRLLFHDQADAFLNLGGFSNITFQNTNKEWLAFDVAPCNLPLNKLAAQKNLPYDDKGSLAKMGKINFFLLNLLNELPYYLQNEPKSLGTEWLEDQFYPKVKFEKLTEDNLRTIIEHVAIQLANVIEKNKLNKVLVTGGGAFNDFLLERVKHHVHVDLVLPKRQIIEYKEALIFALLGALHLNNEVSNVPSATGAKKEMVLGVFHKA